MCRMPHTELYFRFSTEKKLDCTGRLSAFEQYERRIADDAWHFHSARKRSQWKYYDDYCFSPKAVQMITWEMQNQI